MYTVSYYKLGSRWYLDAPEYLEQGGSEEDLECVGAFGDFLELAAEGGITVVLQLDAEPFEGSDHFDLVGSSGNKSGGYYRLRSFRGQEMDLELWFNTMIYLQHARLPQTIFVKRVTPP